MKQYEQTNIDNEIMKVITEREKCAWDTSMSRDAVKMLIEGMAKFLAYVKNKNKVHAAVIEDYNGNFHLGAYVEYMKGEEDGEDSYTLTYTFNPDDIKKEYEKATLSDPVFHSVIGDIGLTKHGLAFRTLNGKEFMIPVMCIVADSIKNYLHANASTDPAVTLDKYFEAKAEIDGNKVYYKITPLEILKQHIKADADQEKKQAAVA